MDGLLAALTMVAALGCRLNAGVFFAFSSFVMKALARLQPAQGIAAMQSINQMAVTPAGGRLPRRGGELHARAADRVIPFRSYHQTPGAATLVGPPATGPKSEPVTLQ